MCGASRVNCFEPAFVDMFPKLTSLISDTLRRLCILTIDILEEISIVDVIRRKANIPEKSGCSETFSLCPCQDAFPLLSIICLSVFCLSVGLSLNPFTSPFILTVFNAFMFIYPTHFLFLLLSFVEISIAICLSIQIHTLTQTHTCTQFSISARSAFMDSTNYGLKVLKKKSEKF